MKKINFIIISMILISSSVYGQSTSKDLANKFFTTYKDDRAKAVRDLYNTNKWTETAKADIEKVVTTVNGFTKEYMGDYNGFELITIKKISASYELHSYLVKYGRQPLRYIFKFYKPKGKWILYSFSLDGDVDKDI